MEINPLKVDLPYPSSDDLKKDLNAARIISPAYAGINISECNAVFQYTYHHLYFEELSMPDYAYALESISITEMIHFEILGQMLLKLGVDPIFSTNPPGRNFYNTSQIAYSKTPVKMLMDDISAEMAAINDYQSMIRRLNNEQVAAVLQRIVLDEMLHLEEFKRLLNKLYAGKNDMKQ